MRLPSPRSARDLIPAQSSTSRAPPQAGAERLATDATIFVAPCPLPDGGSASFSPACPCRPKDNDPSGCYRCCRLEEVIVKTVLEVLLALALVPACGGDSSDSDVADSADTVEDVADRVDADGDADAGADADADTTMETDSAGDGDADADSDAEADVDADADGDGGTSCTVVAPVPGIYNPTAGRTADLYEGSVAVNPCTGEMGFAWSEQEGTGGNHEVYFVLLGRDGTALTTPHRLTAAPGPSDRPKVVWAGDRYALFWEDMRHDPFPDSCTSHCRIELYYAAYDATGTLLVGETRLTDKEDMILQMRAAARDDGEMAVTWVDRRNTTEIYAMLVSPDGSSRSEQQVNETTVDHSEAYTPKVHWFDDRWLITYSDRRSGTDSIYVRTITASGVLEDEHLIGVGNYPAIARRGPGEYTILSEGGGVGDVLRFVDPAWTVVTTVPAAELSTVDGSWALIWDGASHWGTTAAAEGFQLVEYNALGVLLRTVTVDPLTSDLYPKDVEASLIGTTFVIEAYTTAAGTLPYIHHVVVYEP
jgi:hypothetical protein